MATCLPSGRYATDVTAGRVTAEDGVELAGGHVVQVKLVVVLAASGELPARRAQDEPRLIFPPGTGSTREAPSNWLWRYRHSQLRCSSAHLRGRCERHRCSEAARRRTRRRCSTGNAPSVRPSVLAEPCFAPGWPLALPLDGELLSARRRPAPILLRFLVWRGIHVRQDSGSTKRPASSRPSSRPAAP